MDALRRRTAALFRLERIVRMKAFAVKRLPKRVRQRTRGFWGARRAGNRAKESGVRRGLGRLRGPGARQAAPLEAPTPLRPRSPRLKPTQSNRSIARLKSLCDSPAQTNRCARLSWRRGEHYMLRMRQRNGRRFATSFSCRGWKLRPPKALKPAAKAGSLLSLFARLKPHASTCKPSRIRAYTRSRRGRQRYMASCHTVSTGAF